MILNNSGNNYFFFLKQKQVKMNIKVDVFGVIVTPFSRL